MPSNKNISLEYSGLYYTTNQDDWIAFAEEQTTIKNPIKNLRNFLEKKCQRDKRASYSLDDTIDSWFWEDVLRDF